MTTKKQRTCLPWLACAIAAMPLAPARAQTTYTEPVLHSFPSPPKGADPYAGVIRDSAGSFYGTTDKGGAANAGLVYKVNAAGHPTGLFSFTGGRMAANPTRV